jgi:flagellin
VDYEYSRRKQKMRINHNIAALNTYRQLNTASAGQSKSMEKLSSGLRINRAGDDAAGLAISEKMRGQIRGLDMASKNAQDGISLIQTAEGALNETHSILQRMRELAVQASNDTNTDTDRGEIQKEIDQLTSEIDRIGNTTEFNTKTLLNGSQAQKAEITGLNPTGLVSAKATGSLNVGSYDVTVANEAKVAANFTDGSTGIEATDITFGSGSDVGDSFKIIVSDYDATGNAGAGSATLTLQDKDGNELAQIAGANLTTGTALTLDDLTFDASNITGNGTSTFDFGMEADYTITHNGVDVATATDKVSANGTISLGGLELSVDKDLAAGTTSVSISGDALQFQIGANEDQSMRLAIQDMRAAALGVNAINVDSYDNAKSAITTINKAIETVSGERSKLGAVQNRLDHTINNLNTSSENLTAAESRVRDVDMAKEMMEQTKNSILSQAAQAMLAQANQQPQGVLQLLR